MISLRAELQNKGIPISQSELSTNGKLPAEVRKRQKRPYDSAGDARGSLAQIFKYAKSAGPFSTSESTESLHQVHPFPQQSISDTSSNPSQPIPPQANTEVSPPVFDFHVSDGFNQYNPSAIMTTPDTMTPDHSSSVSTLSSGSPAGRYDSPDPEIHHAHSSNTRHSQVQDLGAYRMLTQSKSVDRTAKPTQKVNSFDELMQSSKEELPIQSSPDVLGAHTTEKQGSSNPPTGESAENYARRRKMNRFDHYTRLRGKLTRNPIIQPNTFMKKAIEHQNLPTALLQELMRISNPTGHVSGDTITSHSFTDATELIQNSQADIQPKNQIEPPGTESSGNSSPLSSRIKVNLGTEYGPFGRTKPDAKTSRFPYLQPGQTNVQGSLDQPEDHVRQKLSQADPETSLLKSQTRSPFKPSIKSDDLSDMGSYGSAFTNPNPNPNPILAYFPAWFETWKQSTSFHMVDQIVTLSPLFNPLDDFLKKIKVGELGQAMEAQIVVSKISQSFATFFDFYMKIRRSIIGQPYQKSSQKSIQDVFDWWREAWTSALQVDRHGKPIINSFSQTMISGSEGSKVLYDHLMSWNAIIDSRLCGMWLLIRWAEEKAPTWLTVLERMHGKNIGLKDAAKLSDRLTKERDFAYVLMDEVPYPNSNLATK